MNIAIGSDHAGFELKEKIIKLLQSLNHSVIDHGPSSEESVDYPDYGHEVGFSVVGEFVDRGIVICGTGIGISISANKIKGVRAALCTSTEHARMSRLHNNANILALGARMTERKLALEIVKVWLNTEFEGGRHAQRVDKIEISL